MDDNFLNLEDLLYGRVDGFISLLPIHRKRLYLVAIDSVYIYVQVMRGKFSNIFFLFLSSHSVGYENALIIQLVF